MILTWSSIRSRCSSSSACTSSRASGCTHGSSYHSDSPEPPRCSRRQRVVGLRTRRCTVRVSLDGLNARPRDRSTRGPIHLRGTIFRRRIARRFHRARCRASSCPRTDVPCTPSYRRTLPARAPQARPTRTARSRQPRLDDPKSTPARATNAHTWLATHLLGECESHHLSVPASCGSIRRGRGTSFSNRRSSNRAHRQTRRLGQPGARIACLAIALPSDTATLGSAPPTIRRPPSASSVRSHGRAREPEQRIGRETRAIDESWVA